MTLPSFRKDFAKAVGARALMAFMALQTLGAAIPTEAHAGGDGQGLHVGVKFLQTGSMNIGGGSNGGTHGSTEGDHPVVIDRVPHYISGHAPADDHSDLHTSPVHKYYKADAHGDSDHGSDTKSDHESDKSKYSHKRMMSVVFAHNGSYGDTSGFVDFEQKGTSLRLYEMRAATFLSFEKASGHDHFVGPVSDAGVIALITHGHTPDHDSSLRYAVGPAVDLANGLRVGALFRDDLAQSGATGQVTATWNVPFEVAGREIVASGYADAIGPEGDSSAHGVVKSEIWIKFNPEIYVGGYAKVLINKDGGHEHDLQAGVGIKLMPF